MSDPNPYEPPRVLEPLTKWQVVKRGIGAGVIVLLTPLAVGIATAASCAATAWYAESAIMPNDLGLAIVSGFSMFLGPPIVVCAGMIWWAVRTHKRRKIAALKRSWAAVGNEPEAEPKPNPESDSRSFR